MKLVGWKVALENQDAIAANSGHSGQNWDPLYATSPKGVTARSLKLLNQFWVQILASMFCKYTYMDRQDYWTVDWKIHVQFSDFHDLKNHFINFIRKVRTIEFISHRSIISHEPFPYYLSEDHSKIINIKKVCRQHNTHFSHIFLFFSSFCYLCPLM